MREEMDFYSFDKTRLYMVKDYVDQPKGVIVIVHGLCEHLGRYEYLAGKLNEAGYSVCRFDHRGHGRSDGKKVYYNCWTQISDDVNAVVDMVKAENEGKKLFVLGHSMGGYASTCFASRFPGKADGIILSGALTRYHTECAGPLPIDAPDDTYSPNALGSGVCSDPAVVEAYEKDPLVEKEISVGLLNSIGEGVNWLKENPDKFIDPVLMLHGCCDGLVSNQDSRELFGEIASEDKGLIIYPNLFHEIFNEPCKDEVIADVLLWLSKRVL